MARRLLGALRSGRGPSRTRGRGLAVRPVLCGVGNAQGRGTGMGALWLLSQQEALGGALQSCAAWASGARGCRRLGGAAVLAPLPPALFRSPSGGAELGGGVSQSREIRATAPGPAPGPAPLTVLAGLEGAIPQQLPPGPQVQLVDVFSDRVIYLHMACAHRTPDTSSVLGDTCVLSANTDVVLDWARDSLATPGHTSRNLRPFQLPGHPASRTRSGDLGSQ